MDAVATSRTAACRPSGAGPVGDYKPRRAQASPLFRLVQDHFRTLQTVYDERFAPTYGAWRAVVPEVADKFLACGVLDHGFARVRCDACAHEYLLAFSCKARYFCPSCHAKRLTLWTLWLEETLLAPVPHRQVVLTIPKRLRPWCLYRRALLGDLARVAAKTVTAHDTAALTEAFRRAVLRLFVRRGIFEAEDAEGMLAWPHSGFHVHDGVWVADGDLAFAKRLARYCARNPVALDRLQYDGPAASVQYRSDKRDGPTAGTEAADPLEFLARLVTHIPNKHQVMTRYYGWYANRQRGTRRQAATETATAPIEIAELEALPLREARRRWAELLRRIYEVDPLTCPACGGAMRILAFITEDAIVDQILAHLRRRRGDARGPPSTHRCVTNQRARVCSRTFLSRQTRARWGHYKCCFNYSRVTNADERGDDYLIPRVIFEASVFTS